MHDLFLRPKSESHTHLYPLSNSKQVCFVPKDLLIVLEIACLSHKLEMEMFQEILI